MSIALSEFWTRLVRAGIVDTDGCKRLAMAFTKANSGSPPSSSKEMAKFLLRGEQITRYQAKALLSNDLVDLRFGAFLIQDDSAPPPLQSWKAALDQSSAETGYLKLIPREQLDADAGQWMQSHAAIQSKSLQSFRFESVDSMLAVFAQQPQGRSLQASIKDGGKVKASQVCKIGIRVAEALQSMHEASITHGAVRTDHVWITEDGDAMLLRDPLGPARRPDHPPQDAPTLIELAESPFQYAAPEFADPSLDSNVSTDIYSLGCLLLRMLLGRPPFKAATFAEAIGKHSSETPQEVADAVAAGHSGDPLLRVIGYAIAKNPAARFSSAQQLAGALQTTAPLLVDASKSSPKLAAKSEPRDEAIETKSDMKTTVDRPKAIATPEAPASPRAESAQSEPAKRQQKVTERRKDKSTQETPNRSEDSAKANPELAKPAAPPKPARPPAPPPPKATAPQTPMTPPAPPEKPTPPVTPLPPETPSSQTCQPVPSPESVAPVPPEATPATPMSPMGSDAPRDSAAVHAEAGTGAVASRPRRRRKKKNRTLPALILGGLCVGVLILIVGIAVKDPNAVEEAETSPKVRPTIPSVIPSVRNRARELEETQAAKPAAPAGYELVDDQRLLFVPPYSADTAPPPLELIAPGPAMLAFANFGRLQENAGSEQFIRSLQPEFSGLFAQISKRSGIGLRDLQHVTGALYAGKSGQPEVLLVVELKEARPLSELTELWKVQASRTKDGKTIYAGDSADSDAYFVVDNEAATVDRFAVGSINRISEVAAEDGAPVLLPRREQDLWNNLSAEADLAVLAAPNFLFAGGREMLRGLAPEVIDPLKRLLIPDVAAATLTIKGAGEQLFVETRLAPSGSTSHPLLNQKIDRVIKSWPAWAEQFIVDAVPDASWRLLASRMPSMLRFVSRQVRFGFDNEVVVANTYLPATGLGQVSIATLLAMNTPKGTTRVAAAPATKPLTVDEMLNRKMSVSFDQESLEFAIDAIVTDFKRNLPAGSTMPPVRIIGSDLQKMGITQNQQVRNFDKSDLPLRAVLTDLVVGANPDKSATGPTDPKQALIWVVSDDPDSPGSPVILVTTREAAKEKYELPEEFQIAE